MLLTKIIILLYFSLSTSCDILVVSRRKFFVGWSIVRPLSTRKNFPGETEFSFV